LKKRIKNKYVFFKEIKSKLSVSTKQKKNPIMLWVDKHRPKSISELDCHTDLNETLTRLVESRDFPHLLVYGPSGAGKKTRVMSLLRAHYGESVLHMKLDHQAVQVNESKSIEISLLTSQHHVDINPSDAGSTYDRHVVMHVVKEMAKTIPLQGQFKVVVLSEVDQLSRGAQQALRRTMEKYISKCRLILICESTSRLIAPLRSRCLGIRVPGVTDDEITRVLKTVARKENLDPAPSDAFCQRICDVAGGNLRRALLTLESSRMAKCDMSCTDRAKIEVPVPDWRGYCHEIAGDILTEQSPKKLYDLRQKLYELLSHCIPGDVIMREILDELMRTHVPNFLKPRLVEQAAIYDQSMKLGAKPVIHLEAFVAQVMAALKDGNSLKTDSAVYV
jgi:replication factor C subunit 3/5